MAAQLRPPAGEGVEEPHQTDHVRRRARRRHLGARNGALRGAVPSDRAIEELPERGSKERRRLVRCEALGRRRRAAAGRLAAVGRVARPLQRVPQGHVQQLIVLGTRAPVRARATRWGGGGEGPHKGEHRGRARGGGVEEPPDRAAKATPSPPGPPGPPGLPPCGGRSVRANHAADAGAASHVANGGDERARRHARIVLRPVSAALAAAASARAPSATGMGGAAAASSTSRIATPRRAGGGTARRSASASWPSDRSNRTNACWSAASASLSSSSSSSSSRSSSFPSAPPMASFMLPTPPRSAALGGGLLAIRSATTYRQTISSAPAPPLAMALSGGLHKRAPWRRWRRRRRWR